MATVCVATPQVLNFSAPFAVDAVKVVLYSDTLPEWTPLKEIEVWSTETFSPTILVTASPTSSPTLTSHPWEQPCAARPWTRGERFADDTATEAPYDHAGLDDEFDDVLELAPGFMFYWSHLTAAEAPGGGRRTLADSSVSMAFRCPVETCPGWMGIGFTTTGAMVGSHAIIGTCSTEAGGPEGPVSTGSSWNAARVAAATTAGDATSCYYALFAGSRCSSPGGVYRITEAWYTAHAGGRFDSKNPGCGRVVENWEAIGAHSNFVQDLNEGNSITGPSGDVAAEWVAPFDCTTTVYQGEDDGVTTAARIAEYFLGGKQTGMVSPLPESAQATRATACTVEANVRTLRFSRPRTTAAYSIQGAPANTDQSLIYAFGTGNALMMHRAMGVVEWPAGTVATVELPAPPTLATTATSAAPSTKSPTKSPTAVDETISTSSESDGDDAATTAGIAVGAVLAGLLLVAAVALAVNKTKGAPKKSVTTPWRPMTPETQTHFMPKTPASDRFTM